jgi:hypothetical protein
MQTNMKRRQTYTQKKQKAEKKYSTVAGWWINENKHNNMANM